MARRSVPLAHHCRVYITSSLTPHLGTDVVNVNNFLNQAGSLSGSFLHDAAVTAKSFASDEPCQLGTMVNFNDQIGGFSSGFICAIDDLKAIFEVHVLDNLQTIIDNPDDTAKVQAAVDDINHTRCCSVLPDAGLLWFDVQTSGTGLPTDAPRPDACASIDCTGALDCKAGGLVNGVF